MIQRLSTWLLYKHWGWKKHITVEHPDKFIICLAPHTSNWDFFIGQLFMRSEGIKINFLMKKEWFFWPLNIYWRHLGGIPVWRNKHSSMTDNLAETALHEKTFHLCITPEGTRSLNSEWKKGFYYIALKAQIPILLYGVDYNQRIIQCNDSFIPTGDIDREMSRIKSYFKKYKGKHPEKFSIGE